MYFASRFTRDEAASSFTINTYDDWFLIPTSRPVIQPPKPKQQVVDVPGANGLTDLSRSLTGYPVFQNRQGSNEYLIENDKWPKWLDALTEVSNKLDGQYLRMYFEDEEPEYYYVGTWSVSTWQTGDIYSTITIEYDLYPYKMKNSYSGRLDQTWDLFNFNKDYIMIDTDGNWQMLRLSLNSENQNGSLFNSRSLLVANDPVGLFGEMPTYPVIDIHKSTGSSDWRFKLTFDNNELNIHEEKVFAGSASINSVEIPEFVMTMMNPQKINASSPIPKQLLSLSATWLEGSVEVDVRFKTGRL